MEPSRPASGLPSFVCAAAILTAAVLFAARPAFCLAPLPLHVSGNTIFDSGGRPVVLRGVNIPSVEWKNGGDHIMASLEEAIRHWRATVIRLPVNQDRWEGKMPDDDSGPDRSDAGASYRGLVDRVVQAASDAGVYVIVDQHWSDLGVWGRDVTQHKMPDRNTAAAWADIAARYANNPAVLFDAYNEPHDVSWAVWRNGGLVMEKNGSYETPGMQGLVDVIRGTGAGNLILIGGLDFAFDLRGIAGGYAISGRNIVYSCHIYPSKSPDWDGEVGVTCRIAPVLIGEFGAGDTSPEAANFLPRVLGWIDGHHLGAIAWSLHTAAGPCLIADWQYRPTLGFGAYILGWLGGGPPIPSGFDCSGGTGRITLHWDAVPGASSYTVYRASIPTREGADGPLATGIRVPGYSDGGLARGATYYYRVSAVGSEAASGPSRERGATEGLPGGFDAPSPAFSFRASVPPGPAVTGAPVAVRVEVTDCGRAPGSRILVSMQVHDAMDRLVFQKDAEHLDFEPGQSRDCSFTWTPAAPGTYWVEAGAFGEDFAPKYGWDGHAAVIVVGDNASR
jgi:hypothetical protein